jgi:hypothetical protein
MQPYKNLSRTSNVMAFEIGTDFIRVSFNGTSKVYSYSYRKAGSYHVEAMKRLGLAGSGLNSYINQNVKFLYD